MKNVFRLFVFAVLFVAVGYGFAQEAVTDAPVKGYSIPIEWLPVITLAVNALVSFLQKVSDKVPGIFGTILRAIFDVLGGNTQHK